MVYIDTYVIKSIIDKTKIYTKYPLLEKERECFIYYVQQQLRQYST